MHAHMVHSNNKLINFHFVFFFFVLLPLTYYPVNNNHNNQLEVAVLHFEYYLFSFIMEVTLRMNNLCQLP